MHEFIKLRHLHRITRTLAAAVCGVPYLTLSAWERGTRKPKIDPIIKLKAFIEWREEIKDRAVNHYDSDFIKSILCDDCGKDTTDQTIHNCPAKDVNEAL